MQITKITSFAKKRYLIYIDYEIAFVLYKGDMRIYDIYEGKVLDKNTYDTIVTEALSKRAFARSLYLLEKKDYSEKQIRDKLSAAYYPEEAINDAVAKLYNYNYINDKNYALRYVESHISSRSKNRITSDLYMRGIPKSYIQYAFEKAGEEGYEQDTSQLIRDILTKRHYYDKVPDQKERSKQYTYLLSKGFMPVDINRELKLDIIY